MRFNISLALPLLLATGAVAQNRVLLERNNEVGLDARSEGVRYDDIVARDESIFARGIKQSKPVTPAPPQPAPKHPKLKYCNIMTCHQMCAEGQTRCNSVHNHKGATGLCVEIPGQQT